MVECSLCEPDHLCADADASFVQGFYCHLVSLADLTEHVPRRHAAVVEDDFAGAARPDPELVFLLPERDARPLPLDDKRRDAAIACGRIDGCEHDEHACL